MLTFGFKSAFAGLFHGVWPPPSDLVGQSRHEAEYAASVQAAVI